MSAFDPKRTLANRQRCLARISPRLGLVLKYQCWAALSGGFMQQNRSINLPILDRLIVLAAALVAFGAIVFTGGAQAETIQIVALGASNTYGVGKDGQGVKQADAWPAQLESMLRAKGYDVQISNAGVDGDTTAGEAQRLDSAVPQGTQLVILDPAYENGMKVGLSKAQQNTYIDQIRSRLTARNVKLIVLPPEHKILSDNHTADGVHLTVQGHTQIAVYLMPLVVLSIGETTFTTEQEAQQHCPKDKVVWLNTKKGIYYMKGTRQYGATKNGAYVCQKETKAQPNRDGQ